MAISRMPVTFSDFNSPRYKSSVSKLRKLFPHSGTVPKLSAMRQAFARALGYGSENELRAFAEKLGQHYIDTPLNISEVINSVSQRIARQWNVTAGSAESIALGLGLQHFDACRPAVRSNNQKNEMVNSPATNDSSSDEDSVVLPKPSLTEEKHPTRISQLDRLTHSNAAFLSELDRLTSANPIQVELDRFTQSNATFQSELDRLTNGNPIQAELDRLGAFGLGAAGLGSSPYEDLNESRATRAITGLNESSTMKAIAELNESPTMKAIAELNESPTMRAIKNLQAGSAFAKLERLNTSPAMAILGRSNANPALVALDRLYAIPAASESLSQTDADIED